MSSMYLITFLELAAECAQNKEGNNSTSPEKLFKGRYQSIFSKKDNTLAAAKITNSLKANGTFLILSWIKMYKPLWCYQHCSRHWNESHG